MRTETEALLGKLQLAGAQRAETHTKVLYLLTCCTYSLLTTHYSLLATHYPLLTTRYSLLTTYYRCSSTGKASYTPSWRRGWGRGSSSCRWRVTRGPS